MEQQPNLSHLNAYHYDLPQELIAQEPQENREQSRLLLLDRAKGQIQEHSFSYLRNFLQKGDELIFNDTRVIPARLFGKKKTGARVEIFLVKEVEKQVWDVLLKPAKKFTPGTEIEISPGFSARVLCNGLEGIKRLRFSCQKNFYQYLDELGQVPLPPYIQRKAEKKDQENYQTVFAKNPGAIAAPTAGLHFSDSFLKDLEKKGVAFHFLTLHVGLGTFKPVNHSNLKEHKMHAEDLCISEQTAHRLNESCKGRRICVGTTSCRALESASTEKGEIVGGARSTRLFIYPPYKFKYVDALLTNFHLPNSTLLMMVCAFSGYELTMQAYRYAVEKKFRFFSYGDAMLII